MNRVTHAAGRKVFSRIVDHELSQISKNREQAYEKILDTAQKYMDEFDLGINWEYLRRVTLNQGYTLNTYINSMADQLHPNVLKTTLLNLGYEAFYNGTRTIREMRKIHNCNIPWIILMDPTSACNLHCTGCWAAEYGNKLNLTFDEMDSVITQGKELGIYFYMLTGGEPLVRKKDVIALCKSIMTVFFWHIPMVLLWMRNCAVRCRRQEIFFLRSVSKENRKLMIFAGARVFTERLCMPWSF